MTRARVSQDGDLLPRLQTVRALSIESPLAEFVGGTDPYEEIDPLPFTESASSAPRLLACSPSTVSLLDLRQRAELRSGLRLAFTSRLGAPYTSWTPSTPVPKDLRQGELPAARMSEPRWFRDVTLGCLQSPLSGWQPVGSGGAYEYTYVDLVTGKTPSRCSSRIHSTSATPSRLAPRSSRSASSWCRPCPSDGCASPGRGSAGSGERDANGAPEQLALQACYGAAASGLGLDGERAGQPLFSIGGAKPRSKSRACG